MKTKANQQAVDVSERQRAAAFKAWETRRKRAVAAEQGNIPLSLASITKGIKVRVISEGVQFAGEVLRKLNANTFRVGSSTKAMVAKVGSIYAAA